MTERLGVYSFCNRLFHRLREHMKPTAISATYPYIPRLATRDPSLVKDSSGVYLEL
jgi:hypothetical protein